MTVSLWKKTCISMVLFAVHSTASAALIQSLSSSADANKCSVSNAVTLTGIALSPSTSINDATNSNTYASTVCGAYGSGSNLYYTGNDHPDPNESAGNFGLRNDGFMNMDADTLTALGGNDTISGYSYTDFIKESDLQALGTNYQLHQNGKKFTSPTVFDANDGIEDDPGWIKIGSVENTGDTNEDVQVNGQSLSQILEISFNTDAGNKSGTWELSVKPEGIPFAEGILGREAVFDHLALVLKTGTKVGIYDFNFTDIFGTPPLGGDGFESDFNFFTPYTFYGDWNTSGLDDKALSHWAIYARDPVLQNTQVPVSGSIYLFALSLLLLNVRRIRTAVSR